MSDTPRSAQPRTFVVECYQQADRRRAAVATGSRLRESAASLRVAGRAIRYVGALEVPQDEVIFHVFESMTAGAVDEACRTAGLVFERIVETVAVSLRLIPEG